MKFDPIDPNAPAYPQHPQTYPDHRGLTIRAAMATQILAGLANAMHTDQRMAGIVVADAAANFEGSVETCLADAALNYTDALIAALNGGKQ